MSTLSIFLSEDTEQPGLNIGVIFCYWLTSDNLDLIYISLPEYDDVSHSSTLLHAAAIFATIPL